MEYTPKQMEYIDSVDGMAHMSAVKIIGEQEAENARLKALLEHSKTQLEYDELQAEIAKLQLITGAIEENCWDLRCIDIPTGGGDSDIGWIVVEHNQAEPKERTIGRGKTPAEAIEKALKG